MENTTLAKRENGQFAAPERIRAGVTFTPRVDILETPEELFLVADLPGVRPDDLHVQFENGELVVYGKCDARNENAAYLVNEYGVGDFYRAFSIAESIDSASIDASLKNGVLTVRLPKSEKAKPKRISVKAD